MNQYYLIDTHHHVFPPGFTAHPWYVEQDLEDMEELGIRKSVLSCPLSLRTEDVRRVNEYIASAKLKYPERYLTLASIPFDDPGKAVEEICYCMDELGFDGFSVPSHNDGIYISNDSLDPVFTELNRRRATIFLHPSSKVRKDNDLKLTGSNESAYEYPLDTTRAMMDFIYKNKMLRTPGIRWIVAHAGGVIPYLSYRLSHAKEWKAISQEYDVIIRQIRSLYYDIALSDDPLIYEMLKGLVGTDHITFGSDYPPHKVPQIKTAISGLLNHPGFDQEDLERITHKNAEQLFVKE